MKINSRSIVACLLLIVWLITGSFRSETPPAKPKRPKNIILMIGDGMGISQVSAALYNGAGALNLERFKHMGFIKSYSASDLITDSAAGATAFASGFKTYNNAIGVGTDSTRVKNIVEIAHEKGLATGIVVTCEITNATPAAFYAHQKSRSQYEEIAMDLVDSKLDLFIGGGWNHFCERYDQLNLLPKLQANGFRVKDEKTPLMDIILRPDEKLAYFTDRDRPAKRSAGREYLPDAAAFAVHHLKEFTPNGFFLMVEGSQIDWGGHANDGDYIVSEVRDFDLAIGRVLDFAEKDGETLVIVTADHETGGFAVIGGSEVGNLKYGFTTGGHSADLVPVFAYGPGAELFQGIYDNTDIFNKMLQALHWTPQANPGKK